MDGWIILFSFLEWFTTGFGLLHRIPGKIHKVCCGGNITRCVKAQGVARHCILFLFWSVVVWYRCIPKNQNCWFVYYFQMVKWGLCTLIQAAVVAERGVGTRLKSEGDLLRVHKISKLWTYQIIYLISSFSCHFCVITFQNCKQSCFSD